MDCEWGDGLGFDLGRVMEVDAVVFQLPDNTSSSIVRGGRPRAIQVFAARHDSEFRSNREQLLAVTEASEGSEQDPPPPLLDARKDTRRACFLLPRPVTTRYLRVDVESGYAGATEDASHARPLFTEVEVHAADAKRLEAAATMLKEDEEACPRFLESGGVDGPQLSALPRVPAKLTRLYLDKEAHLAEWFERDVTVNSNSRNQDAWIDGDYDERVAGIYRWEFGTPNYATESCSWGGGGGVNQCTVTRKCQLAMHNVFFGIELAPGECAPVTVHGIIMRAPHRDNHWPAQRPRKICVYGAAKGDDATMHPARAPGADLQLIGVLDDDRSNGTDARFPFVKPVVAKHMRLQILDTYGEGQGATRTALCLQRIEFY